MKVTAQFHLVQKLRMSGTIPLLPVYAFMVLTGKTTFTLEGEPTAAF